MKLRAFIIVQKHHKLVNKTHGKNILVNFDHVVVNSTTRVFNFDKYLLGKIKVLLGSKSYHLEITFVIDCNYLIYTWSTVSKDVLNTRGLEIHIIEKNVCFKMIVGSDSIIDTYGQHTLGFDCNSDSTIHNSLHILCS
jgi:hypothetical protein